MFAAFLRHLITPATITYQSGETDRHGNPIPGATVTWMCRVETKTARVGVQTADGILHQSVNVLELIGAPLVPEPAVGDQVLLPGQVARTITTADAIETVDGLTGPHHLVIQIGA